MSSMLEQAIVDAAALREAALKNAEQAIIEKYAPQIKEAVDSMLESEVSESTWARNQLVQHEGRFARVTTESDNGKVGIQYIGEEKTHLVMEGDIQVADEALLQEEEGATMSTGGETSAPSSFDTIPMAAGISPEGELNASMSVYDFNPEDFNIDLEDLHLSADEVAASEETGTELEDTLGDELDMGAEETEDAAPAEEPAAPEEDLPDTLLEEIFDILNEETVIDMGEEKGGWITTDEPTLKHQQEMELAAAEDSEEKEENEEYLKKIEELDETIRSNKKHTNNLLKIINELNETLNETLLSNAKLLYCNKTLSDASLNERQKNKIVEAIATAKTPDEARTLQETLRATVGTSKSDAPKSLSESVNRKSNLSGIMPRRQKPESFSFAEHMKKLAGIK